jgi:hypothetical protein
MVKLIRFCSTTVTILLSYLNCADEAVIGCCLVKMKGKARRLWITLGWRNTDGSRTRWLRVATGRYRALAGVPH